MDTQPEQLWTRDDVAHYLAVSVRQVDRLTGDPDADFPPAMRIGRQRRWAPAEVRRWAASRREPRARRGPRRRVVA